MAVSNPYLPRQELSPAEDFVAAIIPADSERILTSRQLELEDYSDTIRFTERAQGLLSLWEELYSEPFRGLTADGNVESGLLAAGDERFDSAPAVAAASALLAGLSATDRARVAYAIDADEWRGWYNPEWLVNHAGLRLDDASAQTRRNVEALMRACLSDAGYLKTEQVRLSNLYLGELYDLRHIMNEWSYHLLVFGAPSASEPWGWSIYGHHLALNVFILGGQIVISPTFLGAEPTIIERPGEDSFRLFVAEAQLGLQLQRSLSSELRRQAVIFEQMVDPSMPEGRWHFADERHLGGAYRDNRVVPYEGIRADTLEGPQRKLVLRLVEAFVSYLPDGPRAARMAQVERHLDRTWWSWIGGQGPEDPFYYRIQSPVVMIEFDHHSGVWLTNEQPARYHVHTIVRTPNAGDYGSALLAEHRARTRGDR